MSAHRTAAMPVIVRRAAEAVEAAKTAQVLTLVHQARVELASILIEADLPAGATVMVVPFDDEANHDGTFDLGLSITYGPDGISVGDLGDVDVVAGGYPNGLTAWDDFMADGDWTLIVDRVYAWLDSVAVAECMDRA